MREMLVTLPIGAAEDVLDRLLPLVPGGIRQEPLGGLMQLRLRGHDLPPAAAIAHAVGAVPHRVDQSEVSDDWRERRLADYREELIAERLVVRPDWAPAAAAGYVDIALSDDLAFGSGNHPTTRAILEILLDQAPLGAFADLGCGSAVLGILAAKLGWSPVSGVDVVAGSIASARANAARNGIVMELSVGDLSRDAPPAADGFVANIAAPVHRHLARAAALGRARWGVLSGFGPEHEAAVIPAYDAVGLRVRDRQELHDWSVIVVERDG